MNKWITLLLASLALFFLANVSALFLTDVTTSISKNNVIIIPLYGVITIDNAERGLIGSNSVIADEVVAELKDAEKDTNIKAIILEINSPGGSVTAGLALYDTMQHIKPDVSTICVGIAASMAAVLLSAGAKGKRFILPNAEVMIHQPLGGTEGQASDIAITAKHILKTRENLNKILAKNTGNPLPQVEKDTDRDFYMSSDEAKKYGIVDEIYKPKNPR